VIWKKTKASIPDSFLLKVSLDKTLHTGVYIVQQAELVVGEEGGKQPRLFAAEAVHPKMWYMAGTV
jgi:hypothetical protein